LVILDVIYLAKLPFPVEEMIFCLFFTTRSSVTAVLSPVSWDCSQMTA